MSTPSPFSPNQTSNFTESIDDLGIDDNQSFLVGGPDFDLHGYGHWSTVLVIAIIGTIGNILQFIMMSDSKLSPLSYSVYLKLLTVSDSLVLSDALALQTEYYFKLTKVPDINDVLCKIVTSYEDFIMLLSPWLVVGLTLDKFVCVCFPLIRGRFCTKKKAIVVCSCLIGGTILLSLPSLGLMEMGNYGCIPSDLLLYYSMFLRLVMSSLLPCVIILLLNIAIISRIRRSNEFRNTFTRHTKTSTRDNSTRPLMLVSVLAFVTLLPISASQSISQLFYLLEADTKPGLIIFGLRPAFHIIFLLNFGQNFFILMASSRNYRQIMKRKLVCLSEKVERTHQNLPALQSVGSAETTDAVSMAIVISNTACSEVPVP
ncbi:probable G-protein coupled receptor 139 [Gigantopelta aegis]|uniref:probable G-protein coupled receptor 139 n=1 Tax=Gigantopelta aegis TaxID=1735272 RepID=UPI001B88E095|nr:probable G-protein coupled receptor 139 [Gigantopelta aegis]